ncbi:MAG: GNAT family N-acetyltransferase [Christensenellales bacterium]
MGEIYVNIQKSKIRRFEKIWDKDIANNLGEDCWIRWKEQYIEYNKTGKATTFVVLDENEPIGQITVLFSSDCSAVKNRPMLCDGKTIANMNAFRIDKKYEGQGHISKLVKMSEAYAKEKGITYLTIGSEAKESRNLAIYLHFGYTEFITSFVEDGDLVLFYGKSI